MKFCPECERDYSEDREVCPEDGTRLVFVTQSEDELIGRTVDGRYTLEQRIGEGGMGAVYLATQEAVGRKVALKILRRDLAEDAPAVKRFFHEAKVVSRLRHPNTITLYDFGQSDEGLLYIAMEYMTGQRLDALLDARVPLLPEIIDIVDQVCQSLAEAHEAGIVHRDLKPENIFIDLVGKRHLVKVLDFGIAKVQGLHTNLTLTGMVFGTPAYMSPEQAQGFDLDHRTDLYSLGVVLYELLCGRLPYEGDSAMRMAMSHILSPVPDVASNSRYRPLPDKLAALVRSLMAKRPDERPESAEAVRQWLLEIARELDGYPSSSIRAIAASLGEGGSVPTGDAVGPSGQRVALRERPTPAPSVMQLPEPVPEDTGPNRSSSVFTTAELVERAALEQPVPSIRRSASWPWAAAGAAVALLCAGAVMYALAIPPFGRRSADSIPNATIAAEVPEPVSAPEAPPEVAAAAPAPADVPAPLEPQVTLDPSELVQQTRRSLAQSTVIWASVAPAVLRPVALLSAPLIGARPSETARAHTVPEDVHIALELRPPDSEVRVLGNSEVLCSGVDCLELRLPQGSESVSLVVSRRRYHSRQVEVIPSADGILTVALERDRAVENFAPAGRESAEAVNEPVPEPAEPVEPPAQAVAITPDAGPTEPPSVVAVPAEPPGSPLMAPVIIRTPDAGPR